MSNARAFASLSASLLARKSAAAPAMRPQFSTTVPDPLNDLGWNDPGEPAPAAEPAAALLARKPATAKVVPLVPRTAPGMPASRQINGRTVTRRSRPAAFTLRLDPDRHFALRQVCALKGTSAQGLLTDVLDRLIAEIPDLAE